MKRQDTGDESAFAFYVPRSQRLTERQQQILQLIKETPGATIQTIANRLLCAHQTASYHLDLLVRSGVVVRERDGRILRHYPGPHLDAIEEARFSTFLKDELKRSVIEFLLRHPEGSHSPNALARALGRNHGRLLRELRSMAAAGLVSLTSSGNRFQVRATPRLLELARNRLPPPSALDEEPGRDGGSA